MDSNFKNNISGNNSGRMDKKERFGGADGVYIYHHDRIHTNKMGTLAAKLINILGLTTVFFAFLANINVSPFISICLGTIAIGWSFFRMMKMWEDWRIRRVERRTMEKNFNDNNKKRKSL